jgi:hypothetical protein
VAVGDKQGFDVVNIRSSDNLKYWADKFGVTTKDVRLAVRLVGPSPERVEKYVRAAKAMGDKGEEA